MTRFFRLSVTLAALWQLSACALLEHAGKADELYVLKAQTPAASHAPLPLSITVARPEAAPGLDTARIAVLEQPNHLSYYNGVAWAQPLPGTLQSFLIDALAQSGQFRAVGSDSEGALADVMLYATIEDFEIDHTATPPVMHVRLLAKLTDANSHRIIASFPIDKNAEVTGSLPKLIAGFNGLMNEAAGELAEAIAKTCAGGHSAREGGCTEQPSVALTE